MTTDHIEDVRGMVPTPIVPGESVSVSQRAVCPRCAELQQDLQTTADNLAALEAENARLTEQLHALSRTVMSDQVSNDSHSLFIAAIRDLAAINEALELDPDDGGAVPIIDAIDELKAGHEANAEAIQELASIATESEV